MRSDVAQRLLRKSDLLKQLNWIKALELLFQPRLGWRVDAVIREKSLTRGCWRVIHLVHARAVARLGFQFERWLKEIDI